MWVSPAAALPSQPCWRSVVEAGIPVGSLANAVAARCWQSASPCPGSRAASRKRQEACRSPRSLRLELPGLVVFG